MSLDTQTQNNASQELEDGSKVAPRNHEEWDKFSISSDEPSERSSSPVLRDGEFTVNMLDPQTTPLTRRRRFLLFRVTEIAKSWFAANTGLLLFATAQLFSSTMNLFTRILETTSDPPFHAMQIVFTRMSITMVACTIYMFYAKVPNALLGPKGVRGLLVLRGLFGFFGLFGMYYSLTYLSLSDATVISFLSPSVAGFACSIFLKEEFSRTDRYAGLVSFIGVVMIAQPTGVTDGGDVTNGQRLGAVGVALLGVLGAAGAFTTIRCIGKRAHPLISVNYFSIICTVVSTCVLTFSPTLSFVLPQTAVQWLLLISIGLCGFCYQFMLTAGLQREKAGRAGNMLYLQMFFAFLFEKLVWNDVPDWLEITGSGIILGSAVWVAVNKRPADSGYDKVGTGAIVEQLATGPSETFELTEMRGAAVSESRSA